MDTFIAQSLVQTEITQDGRGFELTFVDLHGAQHTVRLPKRIAAELAPVMASLASSLDRQRAASFTKLPKACAVGHAPQQQLVLIRFDDDPPYALALSEAMQLCEGLREEAEMVSHCREPARQ